MERYIYMMYIYVSLCVLYLCIMFYVYVYLYIMDFVAIMMIHGWWDGNRTHILYVLLLILCVEMSLRTICEIEISS